MRKCQLPCPAQNGALCLLPRAQLSAGKLRSLLVHSGEAHENSIESGPQAFWRPQLSQPLFILFLP